MRSLSEDAPSETLHKYFGVSWRLCFPVLRSGHLFSLNFSFLRYFSPVLLKRESPSLLSLCVSVFLQPLCQPFFVLPCSERIGGLQPACAANITHVFDSIAYLLSGLFLTSEETMNGFLHFQLLLQ